MVIVPIRIELTQEQSEELWDLTRDVKVYASRLQKLTDEIAAFLQESVENEIDCILENEYSRESRLASRR